LRSPSVTRASTTDEQDESGRTSVTSRSISPNSPTNSHSVVSVALASNGNSPHTHPQPPTDNAPDTTPTNAERLPPLIAELATNVATLPLNAISYNDEIFASFEVKKLTSLFRDLCNLDSANYTLKQKLALENSKSMIMQIAMHQPTFPRDRTIGIPPTQFYQYFLVGISLILGVLYSGAESFTGSYDLFNRLLAMSEPTSFVISIMFAVFSNLLFFALEARGFFVEVGIQSPTNFYKNLQICEAKLKFTSDFSNYLRNLPAEEIQDIQLYKENVDLLELFQADIRKDKLNLAPENELGEALPPQGTLRKYIFPTLKAVFSFSGSILFALGGIIIAKDWVANIAALSFGVTLSLPVTNIIILTLALAGFVWYYALQHRGVISLFDALTGRPDELMKEQKTFCDDVRNVNVNINEKIVTLDQRTQLQNPPASPGRRRDVEVTTTPTANSSRLTNGNGVNFHSTIQHRFLPPPAPANALEQTLEVRQPPKPRRHSR
jgi:hypothetical protein